MRETERERGVVLRVLDLSQVIADAQQKIRNAEEALGKEHAADLEVRAGFQPYAVGQNGGKVYVVCNEGVGWEVTDDEPFQVSLYVSRPGFMSIVPTYEVSLTKDEVLAAATDEVIDLADLIRTFGQRLEDNFATWAATLSRKVEATSRG